MRLVLSPRGDPAFQQLLFISSQRLVMPGRWHHRFRIGGINPFDQFALRKVARSDRTRIDGRGTLIQSQITLAGILVRTMTRKATVGKNRSDVTIEIDRIFRTGGG